MAEDVDDKQSSAVTAVTQTQAAGDMAGTGADALNAAEQTKINAHLDAIRADVAALIVAQNLLITALELAGVLADN